MSLTPVAIAFDDGWYPWKRQRAKSDEKEQRPQTELGETSSGTIVSNQNLVAKNPLDILSQKSPLRFDGCQQLSSQSELGVGLQINPTTERDEATARIPVRGPAGRFTSLLFFSRSGPKIGVHLLHTLLDPVATNEEWTINGIVLMRVNHRPFKI